MNTIKLTTPLRDEIIRNLNAGDRVEISGVIYTGRDAAHQMIREIIAEEKQIPFPLEGQIIYYVGPTPAPPGRVIGSAGPTTSTRMDSTTPMLLDLGLKAMIGKGDRSSEVIEAIQRNNCVYFAAIGGGGALIAKSIITAEVIAFPELGTEAVHKLTVKDFPAIVAIDSRGRNLYRNPTNLKL